MDDAAPQPPDALPPDALPPEAPPPDALPPFADLAAALEAGTPADRLPERLRALAQGFGLTAADAPLLRLAGRIAPPFRLPAPDAPGLVVLGASLDLAALAGLAPGALPPASASGAGPTPGAALRACLGEAAELLATTETAAHRAAMTARPRGGTGDAALDALVAALPWPGGRMRTRWHPARRLTDGAPAWLPRELLFRAPAARRAFPPPVPLSLGVAAGPTPEAALLHALEELVERDAVALWWQGGIPGRAIALEDPAAARAAALLARLRGPRAARRRSWLLDITGDLGVPAVAALSTAAGGQGLCCGFAARARGLAPAAEAAVLELLQMELGQALAARKAARHGLDSLNPHDAAHLRRAGIDTAGCALLHPAAPPAAPDPPAAEAAGTAAALAGLLGRLAAAGLAPVRVDHAPAGFVPIPVVRVICPGLESDSAPARGARLREAIARTGGGVGVRASLAAT